MDGAKISAGQKPGLVLAGAGTGKTHRLIEEALKIQRDFQSRKKRDPKLIVCTFSRKASKELKERFYQKAVDSPSLLKFLHSSIEISTIDGILNRFLKKYSLQYGLKPDFSVSSAEESDKIANAIAGRLLFGKHLSLLKKAPFHHLQEALKFYSAGRLQYPDLKLFSKTDFQNFQKEKERAERPAEDEKPGAENLRSNLKSPRSDKAIWKGKAGGGSQLKSEAPFSNRLPEGAGGADIFVPFFEQFESLADDFFHQFAAEKKRRGALQMSDLILFSLDMLRRNPHLARAFSSEWDYWLIDEYQDTNRAQELFIERLTGFKNVFCVGDPKQSIYLFRGADPQVFQRRRKALKNSGGREEALKINYRSRPALVRFFNAFFPEEEGYLSFSPSSDGVQSLEEKTPCVRFLNFEKDGAFEMIYLHIQRLLSMHAKESDICVLSVENKALEDLARFLRARNIALELHSAKGFADKRLILDALFFLKFLINPYDDINLTALLRSPWFFLSDQTIADLRFDHKKRRRIFWDFLREKMKDQPPVNALIHYSEESRRCGIVHAFEKGLCGRGFFDLSHFQDPSGSGEANLWKLLSLLRGGAAPLDLFYALEAQQTEALGREAPSFIHPHALKLMTIHKSKGLEFEHVIVMDLSMEKSLLRKKLSREFILDPENSKMALSVPVGGRIQKKEKCHGHEKILDSLKKAHKEERGRLFYVAMTRAKTSLALTVPILSKAPESNSTLKETSFFKAFEEASFVRPEECSSNNGLKLSKSERSFAPTDNSPKRASRSQFNKASGWRLKNGLYARNGWTLSIEDIETLQQELQTGGLLQKPRPGKEAQAPPAKTSAPESALPFKSPKPPVFLIKSAADFVAAASSGFSKNADFEKDSIQGRAPEKAVSLKTGSRFQPQSLSSNLVFKTAAGLALHHYLRLLSTRSLQETKAAVEGAFLSRSEKEQVQAALEYASGLKAPPMQTLLKEGEAEWPFKLQTDLKAEGGKALLQGQIDLWGREGGKIWVLDYKSAWSPGVRRQLIFYSYILDTVFRPDSVAMAAVYPLDGKTELYSYGEKEKQEMGEWLQSLLKVTAL